MAVKTFHYPPKINNTKETIVEPTAGDFARALEKNLESTTPRRTLNDIEKEFERVRREIIELQETIQQSQAALELRQEVLPKIEEELREYVDRLLMGKTE